MTDEEQAPQAPEQPDEPLPERPEAVMTRRAPKKRSKPPLRDRTWWIVLNAIGIPIYLALFGVGFNWIQDERQNRLEATRQAGQRDIEDGRQAVQIDIGESRAKDNILQSYLDDMTTLMLNPRFDDVPRFSCEERPEARSDDEILPIETLARSRTLVILNQLEGQRRVAVLRFLFEALLFGLIGCDLSGSDWAGEDLHGIILRGADLFDADLGGADLREANLGGANLHRADLGGADLRAANLFKANLHRADLSLANLHRADLSFTYLRAADLRGASLVRANLRDANLGGADLRAADLRGANLFDADLFDAYLGGAEFDDRTTLPDGRRWTPGTDMTRFTVPASFPAATETPCHDDQP